MNHKRIIRRFSGTLRLRLFGGAVLEGVDGPLNEAATQRRRIALLAVLASHP
jgi:hypothetical protein